MKVVKKSFNMRADLEAELDAFVRNNPGVSFTLIMNQALLMWLGCPTVRLQKRPMTEKEVRKFLAKNRGLMEDLSG